MDVQVPPEAEDDDPLRHHEAGGQDADPFQPGLAAVLGRLIEQEDQGGNAQEEQLRGGEHSIPLAYGADALDDDGRGHRQEQKGDGDDGHRSPHLQPPHQAFPGPLELREERDEEDHP